MKNDKAKIHILLIPIMLMTLVAMALSAMRAKYHYDKLYNNKQK